MNNSPSLRWMKKVWGVEALVWMEVSKGFFDIRVRMNASTPHEDD